MKANQKKIEANQEKTDATIKLAWNKWELKLRPAKKKWKVA
jgi:hypothetical protein